MSIIRWRSRLPDPGPWPSGFDELARYNARAADGIVHTEAYAARMREVQARFDAQQADWYRREGWRLIRYHEGSPAVWVKAPEGYFAALGDLGAADITGQVPDFSGVTPPGSS